jgi:hypothetical protein
MNWAATLVLVAVNPYMRAAPVAATMLFVRAGLVAFAGTRYGGGYQTPVGESSALRNCCSLDGTRR